MIKEVRAEVATLLRLVGLEAHHYEPERLNAGCVVVTAGSPYIEAGQTFTDNTMRLDLVVTANGTNEKAQDTLDDLIELTLSALPDWRLESVSEPYVPQAAGAANLDAVVITVTASVTL